MSKFIKYLDEKCLGPYTSKMDNKKKKKKMDEDSINEEYTENELKKINVKSDTVNIKVSDYDGNSTKNLGMNDKQSLMAMKKFIEERMKNLK